MRLQQWEIDEMHREALAYADEAVPGVRMSWWNDGGMDSVKVTLSSGGLRTTVDTAEYDRLTRAEGDFMLGRIAALKDAVTRHWWALAHARGGYA